MSTAHSLGDTLRCDVLIIGAGGAGLRCAAEILHQRPETQIITVTKVAHCTKSHTTTAQGGISAVSPDDPVDAPIYHMFDTWKGSDCSADQNVVKKIVEAGWEQILWLEKYGMHFSRDEKGRFSKRNFGGHTVRFGEGPAFRAVFEADRSGKGIIDTSWGETLRHQASFINNGLLTELLFKSNRCVGAVVFCQKTGEFIPVLAKATVLAAGGSGQMFRVTTNCRQNTGDILAVAMQSGLPVMDMEAVQFHPTGIVGPGILASETLRVVGGILRNKDLEPFMESYAPKMKELAPRDLVARAIETEILEGRGILNKDHEIEHAWLDLTHLPDNIHDEQIPEVSGFFRKFVNIDPKKDMCPIRPSVHYHMGGIPTDEFGAVQRDALTNVPGLFAVGECAAASFHGFNRLGTNSLLELITMGKFVGQKILEDLSETPLEELPPEAGEKTFARLALFFDADGQEKSVSLRTTLQSTMTEKVGVFRNENGMSEAVNVIKELKERSASISIMNKSLLFNQELLERWELDNLLSNALVLAESARRRRESRGGHARKDFPERSDAFNYHTLAYMGEFGQFEFGKRTIDMSLYHDGDTHHEKFGNIERKY